MPELPEVQTVVSELNRKLKNKTVRAVSVRTPKVVAIGPQTISNIRTVAPATARRFERLIVGRKIVSVKRRAKLLIFDLSGPLTILAHLKMTGQFIYEDKKLRQRTGGKYRIINKLTAPKIQLPSKYTHVIFYFTDGSVLYFNDVRQFGYLKLIQDSEVSQVPELQNYGPEPLSKKFTFAIFKAAIQRRLKGKIKQILMDPSIVAGIGNIYSDEILFHAKVRPVRAINSLTERELKAIYKNIPIVLKQAIKHRGSSVGDFVRTDGSWGSMGKFHFVYGRAKQPCKVCATIIESVKLGGRTGSFCPLCQK